MHVERWPGSMSNELAELATWTIQEPASRARVALRQWRRTKSAARRLEHASIRRLIRRENPDLVWCNTVMCSSYAVIALEMGVPVVLHGHEQLELLKSATANTGLSEGGNVVDPRLTLVACGTSTAVDLANALGTEPAAVHVLHSAVDVHGVRSAAGDPSRADTPNPMVLGCGMGNVRKGIDAFNAAATLSAENGEAVTWVWVGNVDERDRVESVIYKGEVDSALPWLAAANVVVVPSRADPFPLVVLEAMALSRPVVASDLPGIREQLGDSGVFVPPGEPQELSEAVSALLQDPEKGKAMGAAGAARCTELWDILPFAEHAVSIARAALEKPHA